MLLAAFSNELTRCILSGEKNSMANNNDKLHDFHNYNCNIKTREIFLHNHYGSNDEENPGVEYKMSNTFLKNLRALDQENNNDITIHMQSVGGEWSDGMAIFDAIKICRSKITIIVYGQAESMSSIILQAADKRLMTPNAYFMSHYGSTEAGGHYLNVQNWVKYEKQICEVMMDIYASRCVKGKYFKDLSYDQDKVKKFLYRKLKCGDWYINANESVHYGFADGIINKWH